MTVQFASWQAATLSIIGLLLGLVGGGAFIALNCFNTRIDVFRELRTTFAFCDFELLDSTDFIPKFVKEFSEAIRKRMGATAERIYNFTFNSTRVFAYSLSPSKVEEATRKGEGHEVAAAYAAMSDLNGYAYIFIPRSAAATPLVKFLARHEIAHAAQFAGIHKMELLMPFAIGTVLLATPFHLVWDATGTLLYLTLVFCFLECFSPRSRYLDELVLLQYETMADIASVDSLDEAEKSALKTFFMRRPFKDRDLRPHNNLIRRDRMLKILSGHDIEPEEIATTATFQKVILALLTLALGFRCAQPGNWAVFAYTAVLIITMVLWLFLMGAVRAADAEILKEAVPSEKA